MLYKKNENLKILNHNSNAIAFDLGNGQVMVNATQMAKEFGKKPVDWLRFEQSKRYIDALSVVRNHTTADLVRVKQGGTNQGTWFHEDVAIEFARWLSPEFGIWCNDRVKELLLNGNKARPIEKKGTYVENQIFINKLGLYSAKGYYSNGKLYFAINDVIRFTEMNVTASYLVNKFSGAIKVLDGNQSKWFADLDWYEKFMNYYQHKITFDELSHIYRDLFNIEKNNSSDTPYTYFFTDAEMLQIIKLANRFGKPKLQSELIDKLMGGRR